LTRNNLAGPTWTVAVFTDVEKLINLATESSKNEFCFGINFKTFDVAKNDFEVEFMFTKRALPDTNLDAFSPLYKNPDLTNWGRWFRSGAPQLYPYITEFIARAKTNTAQAWS